MTPAAISADPLDTSNYQRNAPSPGIWTLARNFSRSLRCRAVDAGGGQEQVENIGPRIELHLDDRVALYLAVLGSRDDYGELLLNGNKLLENGWPLKGHVV